MKELLMLIQSIEIFVSEAACTHRAVHQHNQNLAVIIKRMILRDPLVVMVDAILSILHVGRSQIMMSACDMWHGREMIWQEKAEPSRKKRSSEVSRRYEEKDSVQS